MVEMSAEDFERLVADELDALPDAMVEGLDNIVFMVEDRPEDGSDLLGVYEGFSVVDRSIYGYGEMPDRIVLYRENLLGMCDSREELADEVHITLVHEIAHYFGIEEERLHELGWG
ncbi:metallopeptidase family protein [Arcanobacterium haemolyticum]|nr:metallopeptidase family protein [Arcanobacterium haemolyticum]